MDNIIFEPIKHRYTVNGVEVPSVSEIIRFIAKEVYGKTSKAWLDIAADKGTRIHRAAEDLDTRKKTEVDEDIAGYVEAYRAFLMDYSPKWAMIEGAVNYGVEYAGTIDRYGFLGSQAVLVDIKSNTTIGKKHKVLYGAQLNLYRMALEYKSIPIDSMFLLHLKKDGTYQLIPVEKNNQTANACLLLHRLLAKGKRKKKG